MENIYVIAGATGNTGHLIAENLLDNGKKVLAIARNQDKLKTLIGKGAKILAGDIMDTEFLKKSLKEATAAYLLIPPSYQQKDFRAYQNKVTESFVNALEGSAVKYIVALSSIGGHMKKGAGVVQGLHDFEEALKKLKDINILILRPGYFMENFFGSIEMIKNMHVLGSPTKADVPVPMVATRDIAEIASNHLLKLDFSGTVVQYVLGPRDMTFNEAASVLGKAIGVNDLKYVQFPYEDAKKAIVQSGLSESTAEAFVDLSRAFNSGEALNDHVRTFENTTPTSLEDFAKEFAAVYNS
ncbi:MAG: NAD(P)H-binding protein [Bacillota bacterium]